MRHLAALLLACSALSSPALSQSAPPRHAGSWEGVIRMTLAPSAGGWMGTVTLPARRIEGRAVDTVRVTGDIVAHELVHYQQDYAPGNTLLRQSLVEGVADFVGELISGRHINPAAQAYRRC